MSQEPTATPDRLDTQLLVTGLRSQFALTDDQCDQISEICKRDARAHNGNPLDGGSLIDSFLKWCSDLIFGVEDAFSNRGTFTTVGIGAGAAQVAGNISLYDTNRQARSMADDIRHDLRMAGFSEQVASAAGGVSTDSNAPVYGFSALQQVMQGTRQIPTSLNVNNDVQPGGPAIAATHGLPPTVVAAANPSLTPGLS